MEPKFEFVFFICLKGSSRQEMIQEASFESVKDLTNFRKRDHLLWLCDAIIKDIAIRSETGIVPDEVVHAVFNALTVDLRDDTQQLLQHLMSSLNPKQFKSLNMMALCIESCRRSCTFRSREYGLVTDRIDDSLDPTVDPDGRTNRPGRCEA